MVFFGDRCPDKTQRGGAVCLLDGIGAGRATAWWCSPYLACFLWEWRGSSGITDSFLYHDCTVSINLISSQTSFPALEVLPTRETLGEALWKDLRDPYVRTGLYKISDQPSVPTILGNGYNGLNCFPQWSQLVIFFIATFPEMKCIFKPSSIVNCLTRSSWDGSDLHSCLQKPF